MFSKETYTERREKLAESLSGGLILLPGNEESPMNYTDNTYHFRQDSTFLYYFVELLQTDEAGPARGHLAVIVAESQRLSRLIGNVLTFARHRRDKLALRKTTARVDEVIGRVLRQFEPVFRRSEIEVTFDGSADSPVRVDVDAVEQILGNLFGNVEKYAAGGHRLVILSRQEDDHTIIEVADRGPGIPAAFEENVFRPFYRISDRIDRGTGTGIGLSIARQLARLHGGDVTLLRSDVGARFQVRLNTKNS